MTNSDETENSQERFPGEFQAGDVVGGTYRVTDYLGRGAMGHVYQAEHAVLKSVYALKTVSKDKVSDLAWKRFQNEAQAIAIMNHPNIVSIYNLGLHEQVLPFYVMDILKGADLAHKLRQYGPMPVAAAAKIYVDICAGLAYAHSKGIIHRDIKPGNIFILDEPDASGATVKIVDFGIAKVTETRNQDLQSLTEVGDVVGTPYYMSPEQCKAMPVDGRTDIYSLGCMLFESLTGSLPFRGRNPTETMLLHESHTPPTLSKASGGKEFDKSIEYIVATCLAKDADERYQKIEQLADDLKGMMEESGAASTKHLVSLHETSTAPSKQGVGSSPLTATGNASPTLHISGTKVGGLQGRAIATTAAAILIVVGLVIVSVQTLVNSRVAQLNSKIDETSKQKTVASVNSTTGITAAGKTATGIATTSAPKAAEKDAEFPDHQIVTASLLLDKPFSSMVTEGKIQYRLFNFPTDSIIGLISSSGGGPMVRAAGQLKYPADERVTFTPCEIVERCPKSLKRFRPGDVYAVKFNKRCINNAIVAAVAGIPDVEMLDFDQCWDMSHDCKKSLNTFSNLKAFNSPYCLFEGNFLADCKCWDKLEVFSTADFKKPVSMFKRLKSCSHLKRLIVKNSQMKEEAFRAIAALSQVEHLNLDGCYVTKKNLADLSTMSNLKELDIQNTTLDASCSDILKGFKSLKSLYIQSQQLKARELEKLKAALPGIQIY